MDSSRRTTLTQPSSGPLIPVATPRLSAEKMVAPELDWSKAMTWIRQLSQQFGNISTRGFVETGTNVMIGGFILGGQSGNANVVVRAFGPSLTHFGVTGALTDPTLELRDGNGALVRSNDNWKDTQQTEIEATGLQPTNDLESAVFEMLPPGAYTAIVAGKGDLTGVGLVEVYRVP